MFPRLTTALLLCIFFSFLTPLRGERIVLKSGKILTGSIVDYDEHMFRVETDFGFALIRKDRVASISFEESETPVPSVQKDEPEPEKGSAETAESKAVAQGEKNAAARSTRPITAAVPEPISAVESESATPESESVAGAAPRLANSSLISAEPEIEETAEAATVAVSLETTRAEGGNSQDLMPEQSREGEVIAAVEGAVAEEEEPIAPPRQVEPGEMVERIEGNLYINETFRFAMYKPPNWVLFEDVRRASATSVIAMGTVDERTLLFVEREPFGAELENQGGIEAKLRQTYREYQVLGEEDVIVDGRAGVRRTFSGVLDGIDWHGMAVHVSDDYGDFGIIGLTSAETFQFKQAVFNKIVRTFRFTTP